MAFTRRVKRLKKKSKKITYKGGTHKGRFNYLSQMFRSKDKPDAAPTETHNPLISKNYHYKEGETDDDFNQRIGSFIREIKKTESHDLDEIKEMVEIFYVIMQKIQERNPGLQLPDKKDIRQDLLKNKSDLVEKIKAAVTKYDSTVKKDEDVFTLLKTVYTLCTK